jgi:hypothetical protein
MSLIVQGVRPRVKKKGPHERALFKKRQFAVYRWPACVVGRASDAGSANAMYSPE